MKSPVLLCFFAAPVLFAQPSAPSSAALPVGQVIGHVICADTDAPARSATVQLIPEKPPEVGLSGMGQLEKNPDLSRAMLTVLSSMLKGSGLSTLAGMDGSFEVDKVPAGIYYAVAQLPGYESPLSRFSAKERMAPDAATLKAVESVALKVIVQPSQSASAEIRIERGGSISGEIRYDDGSPAPGVAPVLMTQGDDGKWKDLNLSMLPSTTDDRGHYRFFGLPPGKYAVKAALPTVQASVGLGAGSLSMNMNTGDALVVYSGGVLRNSSVKPVAVGLGDQVEGVDLVFPVSGLHTISGSVLAKSDNHPVNGGTMALLDPSTKEVLRTATIQEDGSFRLNYVPDGQYVLSTSGAADLQKSDNPDQLSDFARMMNSKPLKTYGRAELPLNLTSDATGITLQVPDATSAGRAAPN